MLVLSYILFSYLLPSHCYDVRLNSALLLQADLGSPVASLCLCLPAPLHRNCKDDSLCFLGFARLCSPSASLPILFLCVSVLLHFAFCFSFPVLHCPLAVFGSLGFPTLTTLGNYLPTYSFHEQLSDRRPQWGGWSGHCGLAQRCCLECASSLCPAALGYRCAEKWVSADLGELARASVDPGAK